MRRRNNHINIWLSDKEFEYLQQQAKIAGRNHSTFIRDLIRGTELKERPPEAWAELVRQLSAIGNNINQIARIANTNQSISQEDILMIQQLQSDIWRKVKSL